MTAFMDGLRLRWRARMLPVARAGRAPVRLVIGPANSAGQAHRWARSAERLRGVRATSFAVSPADDTFRFPVDARVGREDFASNYAWTRRQIGAVERGFSHVVLESGATLWRADAVEHVAALRERGAINVGLVFHGSDIRVPHVHAQLEPDSPFADGRYPDAARLEEVTARNHRLVRESGAPVFVATPQLLDFLPDAAWLPVVVDPEPWERAASGPALTRDRPIVVHAPSRRGLKGSERIEPALQQLDREGVIVYREISGVPASRMPSIYGGADIVLDQFVNGGYGVAACEAMAAGRVVLAHVSDRHRRVAEREAGMGLPIVEARVDDIGEVIRGILADRAAYAALAGQGPEFVRRMHDGARSAAVLSGFLGVAGPRERSGR
ncbi:hypothetical protein ACWDR7_09735 [Microbacterium sp. NPDC003461]